MGWSIPSTPNQYIFYMLKKNGLSEYDNTVMNLLKCEVLNYARMKIKKDKLVAHTSAKFVINELY